MDDELLLNKIICTALAIALLLLLVCMSAHWAEAQAPRRSTVKINLVVVKRSDISTQQQIDLFLQGMARLRELNIYTRIMSVTEVPDVIGENDMAYYIRRLFSWAAWGKANKLHRRGIITHYLLPPVISNGRGQAGGVAGAICTIDWPARNYSYSIMRLTNDDGADRRVSSTVIAAHEILHNLGASHFDRVNNVMRSYYSEGPQIIVPLTKREVRNCIREG